MKNLRKLSLGALLAVLASLAGCASTPQAALDQANNGAALTMALQAEVQKFRQSQVAILEARLAGVRKLQITIARYESDAGFDARVLAAAGKMEIASLQRDLVELSDSRITDEQALAATVAALNEAFDKLLTPLPDATKELTAAQKALATLGDQLSAKERFEIVSGFVKTVQKSIEDNKKKIDEANAKAPEPTPAQ
jgi:hypothetical protein